MQSQRVMQASTARAVRAMLTGVVSDEGTGLRASVPGYHVAGKTGTVRKSADGGYADDRYLAVFAGMAPASAPRLVTVVMINDPRSGDYYGGEVAAPVFARVMERLRALREVEHAGMTSLVPLSGITHSVVVRPAASVRSEILPAPSYPLPELKLSAPAVVVSLSRRPAAS